jgi:MFS family permease
MQANAADLSASSPVRRPAHVNGAAVLARDRDGPRPQPSPGLSREPKADHGTASRAIPVWRVVVLVLLPFVSGYYLSYLYRAIGALISEALVSEFALTAAHLGFLTSTYFLAFGIVQLPIGVWLDRFGPRRVQAVLMSVAACGAALFASAGGFAELALGRALIGLGVAGALMAGLKAIVLWFPPDRTALANGWFMMLGALGAVTATAPAEMLVGQVGWRGMFAVLACATAASALLILLVVPERHRGRRQEAAAEAVSIAGIYRDRRFWRLAPLSATCVGSAWALQGLWAAPWFADVEGLERSDLVKYLLTMAIALSASALLLGAGAHRLRRRWGISLELSFAGATGVALLAQLALVLRWPLPAWLPWIAIAGIGAGTVLSYSILTGMFPKSASARANGALNVLHVSMAFTVQYAVGLIVQQWPQEAGHYPPIAYQTALGLNLALQGAAFAWFLWPQRQSFAHALAAHPIHALAHRLGVRPSAAVPYALARCAWHSRLADARAQATMWRATAFASFAVLGLLCACVGMTILATPITAHVLHVERIF